MNTYPSHLYHLVLLALCLCVASEAAAQGVWPYNMPEQRRIPLRNPASLPRVPVPNNGPPETVIRPFELPQRSLSLDEAIRIGLENATVIRVLAGVTAVSSGNTVYDPAIQTTQIDTQRSRFDPRFNAGDSVNHSETGAPVPDGMAPGGVRIGALDRDLNSASVGVNKTTIYGGQAALSYNSNGSTANPPGLLNPFHNEFFQMRYDHPLLRGSGSAVNLAPIVLARIDTQSSYFRLKGSVQDMVRGVIEAYWQLVVARVDVWARERQVEQGQVAYDRAEARRGPLTSSAEVAQTRLALANFRNTLIASRANVLLREAALRNILGLPPDGNERLVPVTAPTRQRAEFDWNAVLSLAERQRPDIVQLKLVLEADQQRLILAENEQWPDLNTFALYRWNGVSGEAPAGVVVRSGAGQLTDWALGINFEVPIGLRAGRVGVRRQELNIARDRANLQQGIHAMSHLLALNLRNLDQYYEQYLAIREVRQAATDNLAQQAADYGAGRSIFLNVLQAITDWGNSVSSEAAALALYNVELANLELQTGTILETHGVRFYEERFGAIGPLGERHPRWYPRQLSPGPNSNVYPSGDRPAEESFNLKTPVRRRPGGPDPYFQPPDTPLLPTPQIPEPLELPRPLPPIGNN